MTKKVRVLPVSAILLWLMSAIQEIEIRNKVAKNENSLRGELFFKQKKNYHNLKMNLEKKRKLMERGSMSFLNSDKKKVVII